MKTTIPSLALLLLSLTACSGAGTPINRALDHALESRSWQELRLDAECLDENGPPVSARLLGTGVGIWNQERQFEVPRDRLLDVLAALRRGRFGARNSHEEEEEREEHEREEREREKHARKGDGLNEIPALEEEEEEGNEPDPPCRLLVRLDGVEAHSDQLSRKRQLTKVKDLAGQILAIGSELGPAGMAAASLEDGLDKIARGELAPETLTLQLQRQPEDPRSQEGGWLLAVEDGFARLSLHSPGKGWTEPRRVRLAPEEAAGLARRLAAVRPSELPVNLYSSSYQDLQIGVLNRTTTLQARRFGNLTSETHGEKQQRFEQLIAALEELKRTLAP